MMGATDNLPEKLSNASIFAFSSLYEGFAMVLTEAMACGLPVVSYACPYGPEEIVTNGIDGFLVQVGDEEKLAERIEYLIEQESVRKEMGEAALEKSKQFEMDKIIGQWMALFRELIEEKRISK
jgi:glycosyltransferase involved in cell wall biosynthesis